MKTLTLFILCMYCHVCSAQQDRYVIQISDKSNNSFTLSNPLDFLSPASINRRMAQGISLDSADLPVSPAYVSGIANTGAQILNTSKWLNTVSIYTNNPSVITAVQSLPYVVSVTNVGRSYNPSQPGKEKNESISPLKYGNNLHVTSLNYGPSERQIKMMNGDALHDLGYKGNNMLIAVIDAGFYFADSMIVFDSVRANNRIKGIWDFVDGESNVYNDGNHGSYVWSTMAAYWEGNIIGTAPEASYLLLRSEDVGSEYIIEEYNWASAAEYADSAGADIINSSLGYTEFNDSTQNHTHADQNGWTTPVSIAASIASQKGMIVCNSAGNEGNSPWQKIMCPADAVNILSVAAVDSAGLYVSFSSRGHSADGRIKPDVAAMGLQTIVASPWAPVVHGGNGTSFASPLMAGMAACLWQAYPSKSNTEIMQAIRSSASQFNNPDSLLGYGIPNFLIAFNSLGVPQINGSVDPLHIYPIPFKDNISIESIVPDHNVLIQFIDMSGRLVKQLDIDQLNNTWHISSSDLQKGMYILLYRSNAHIYSRKIIKL